MRRNTAAASLTVTSSGILAALCLLTTPVFSAHASADAPSSTDASSEWKTTHSDEEGVPPPGAGTKSTSRNVGAAASRTSRKPPATHSNASGSKSKQPSGKKNQQTAGEAKPEPFGIQIEKLFRGIGADLEEFFVGTRTVDKDD